MRFFFASSLALLVALVAAPPRAQSQQPGAYLIGPRDVVEIRVQEDPSLDMEATVDEDGEIELPYIGGLKIADLTTEQAAARVRGALERYLQTATVSLRVKEFRSRPIRVLGEVNEPQTLPDSGRWTLLEALSEAGGPTGSHGGRVLVRRRASNGLSALLEVPMHQLWVEADWRVNIPIQANDLISVPAAAGISIHCLGELRNPGQQTFRDREEATLLAAIARAGGLTERASANIVIRRKDQEYRVNYKKIVRGKEPDFQLREGDFVIVKESFF